MLLMWTPKGDQLGRTMRIIHEYLVSANYDKKIVMISPLSCPVGCDDATQVLDVWG